MSPLNICNQDMPQKAIYAVAVLKQRVQEEFIGPYVTDKATHVLHIDIAEPLTRSDDGFSYFLVGALRLPGLPLLIDARALSELCEVKVIA